jgi:hypothetical protein
MTMMTREEVLAEMEADFAIMNEEEKNMFLFTHEDQDWTPNKLIVEVRNSTPFGLLYVEQWSANKQARVSLDQLLALLMGAPGVEVIDLTLEEDDEDALPEIPGLTSRGGSKPS